MKKHLVFLACALLTVFLASCGSGNAGNGNSSSGAGGEFGDTINFGINTDIQDLMPPKQNDTTSEQVVKMIYSTLLVFKDDGTVVGDLAESWSVTDDGLIWTFKLKPGIKFHNGKTLTANDVKATFDLRNSEAGSLRTVEILRFFSSVDVVDDLTVTIATGEPYGPMEALMCNMMLGIMDADFIGKYTFDELDKNVEAQNGTGPYKIISWEKDTQIALEKFDGYFGEKAKTKTINYIPIPEASARIMALENGEVDVIQTITADVLPDLEANPNIVVLKKPSVGQRLFRFGCNDPIIGNTKVRQAISYAIDRQLIIDGLFNGVGYPSTSVLAPVTWGYHKLGSIERDLDKAKALLAEAGYPNGFSTKIVTTERYSKGTQMAEVLSQQLKEVGINAAVDVWEWSTLAASWNGIPSSEFDQPIFIMGAGPSMRDADGGLRGLYTTTETGLNDRNYGFYSNAEVDELVYAGMKETDTEARKALYARAAEILYLEDPVGIWLYDQYGLCAYSTKVEGVNLSPISTITFESATIKK